MARIRALLCGISLFYLTFWLPVAAAIYTPFWYDLGCRLHGRCAALAEGQPPVVVRELTAFLTHTGALDDPGWSGKERRHLSEARARLDGAAMASVVALMVLSLTGSGTRLRTCALVNLAIFPLLTGILPFFTTVWRDLFHPLFFSNNLWLNTPLDLSFYLMPRRFFYWTLVLGIGCAVVANAGVLWVTWRAGRGEGQGAADQTTQRGGAMKRIGWMALGLVVGILGTVGGRMAMERGLVPNSVADAVVEQGRGPVGGEPSSEAESLASAEGLTFAPDMDRMRENLPGNLAIPPKDATEKWMRAEAKKARNELFGRISATLASDVEVHSYYDEQAQLTRDSIAMLEWILTEHEAEMSQRDKSRHLFLLEQFKKRLAAIPDREARMLERMQEKKEKMPPAARG